MTPSPNGADGIDIKFSHVQLYVDRVCPVSEYKEFESSLNKFHESFNPDSNDAEVSVDNICKGQQLWNSLQGNAEEKTAFVSHGRDVVKQLIAGFGFRVTGCYPDVPGGTTPTSTANTNSVLVTSSDPNGIQILVTSVTNDKGAEKLGEYYHHFDASNVDKFYNAHSKRQGIAVLAFEVGPDCLDQIFRRYSELHPNLLPSEYKQGVKVYENEANVFEVFAYYKGEQTVSIADQGTKLRFVEPVNSKSGSNGRCKLPGIISLPAEFHSCHPAYFDHWVSNVVNRTGFLETLEDVLYFTPKVDFNAGVVAAGEAQIESTVTGNKSAKKWTTTEKDAALKDQSQIYLPINNALTEVGHVHGFLEEIGQGVQHIASRVGNIIDFIQQANDRRKMFGEGFTFLNIPRSYYGILTRDMLVKGLQYKEEHLASTKELLSPDCANFVYDICVSEGLLHDDCSLILDTREDTIKKIIDSKIPALHQEEYSLNRDGVVKTILHSRYVNLYNLLRDHLSEDSYVSIVRNKILVDVQGEDLLFQIFTSNILQRNSGEEAPFFEFIQRVCSECIGADGCPKKLKPGCGGFGIRNFLTLFLSIEVTKAMFEASNAKDCGDDAGYAFAQRKVDLFTEQLNESNPLLTEISDAMTREGMARDNIAASNQDEKKDDNEKWKLAMENESLAKARANEKLMECNLKYRKLMKELRESQSQR
mmetsp:Transcript_11403/g.21044  ORF Transcript_11403/g.21044 Transcript_11403/m.21044 type:complete len:703 (-) Transcript_11403:90-2198(-)